MPTPRLPMWSSTRRPKPRTAGAATPSSEWTASSLTTSPITPPLKYPRANLSARWRFGGLPLFPTGSVIAKTFPSRRPTSRPSPNQGNRPRLPRPRPRHMRPHCRYEFRLARFDAPPDGTDPDHPIHITLEVFRRDDCPEYETVSYTWGGEEDDSTPCPPGPYWDVLLQTGNCWHMLRYLRPRRGIRLVWIDAICINQSDPAERALQVSKMRSVYQQCSRVVIYLGADLVAPPTSDTEARMHPPRHGLHEFDRVMGPSLGGNQEKAMTLPDLLTRWYFTRVWVIQEVLLSRAAIVPIAGREFWANCLTPIKYVDARTMENLSRSEEWDWESTTAPWTAGIIWVGLDLHHSGLRHICTARIH